MLNQIQTPKHSGLSPLSSWEMQGAGLTWDQLSLGWPCDTPERKEKTQINLLWETVSQRWRGGEQSRGCGSLASRKSQRHGLREQHRLKSSTWKDGQEVLDCSVAALTSNYILNPPSKPTAQRDLGADSSCHSLSRPPGAHDKQ